MTSLARRTNIVLIGISSFVVVLSVAIAVAADSSPQSRVASAPNTSTISTTSTTTAHSVVPDNTDVMEDINPFDDEFEIREPYITIRRDRPSSGASSYWLEEAVPARPAAILPNQFTYGKSSNWIHGSTEPENNEHDFGINSSGPITCPKSSHFVKKPDVGSQWSQFEACSVMSSESGQFLVIVRSAWLNEMDKRLRDALKIEIFVPRKFSDGTRRAVYVMGGYFGQSLCADRRLIALAKVKVGPNDALVVSDSYAGFSTTQTTVIAMNSAGMPIVVASYEIETNDDVWLNATDRSLVLTTGRIGDASDDWSTELTLRELVPGEPHWNERLHFAQSATDPLIEKIASSPKPYVFAEYDFRLYTDDRSSEWCSLQN